MSYTAYLAAKRASEAEGEELRQRIAEIRARPNAVPWFAWWGLAAVTLAAWAVFAVLYVGGAF